jgi:hypothetical protein
MYLGVWESVDRLSYTHIALQIPLAFYVSTYPFPLQVWRSYFQSERGISPLFCFPLSSPSQFHLSIFVSCSSYKTKLLQTILIKEIHNSRRGIITCPSCIIIIRLRTTTHAPIQLSDVSSYPHHPTPKFQSSNGIFCYVLLPVCDHPIKGLFCPRYREVR